MATQVRPNNITFTDTKDDSENITRQKEEPQAVEKENIGGGNERENTKAVQKDSIPSRQSGGEGGNHPTEKIVKDEKHRNSSIIFDSSATTMLPIHPYLTPPTSATMNPTLEPYFSATEDISDSIRNFWMEAHTLSCLRRRSFDASPEHVRCDFRTSVDGCVSLCVNEALGVSTDGKKLILVSGDEEKSGLVSSLAEAVSSLSVGASNDKISNIVDCIGQNLQSQELLSNTKTKVATPATSTIESGKTSWSLFSPVAGIAKTVAGGIGSGLTYILASYDLADDPNEYGETYDGYDYGEEEEDLDEAIFNTSAKNQLLVVLDDHDMLINIPLVVRCCNTLLEYCEYKHKHGKDKDGIHFSNKMLVYRNGGLRTFCQEAGTFMTSSEEQEKIVMGTFLQQINAQSTEFLARVLLAAGRAQESEDGEILALIPATNTQKDELSTADVALFRLSETQSALEKRIDNFTRLSDLYKQKALTAKTKKNTKLALIYMKRRAMITEEYDRCTTQLLNVEQSLQSLQQTLDDKEVMDVYRLCTDALRVVKLEESEGGMGMSHDNVENVLQGLQEEVQEAKLVGDALSSASAVTGESFDEGELEEEFRELEKEVMSEELDRMFPPVPNTAPGGS